jgi:hypothetical protein
MWSVHGWVVILKRERERERERGAPHIFLAVVGCGGDQTDRNLDSEGEHLKNRVPVLWQ